MHEQLLDFLARLDMSRHITRQQLLSGLKALLGERLADISDSDMQRAIRKLLPATGKLRPPGASGPPEFFLSCRGGEGCRACGEACDVATASRHVIKFFPEDDAWWGGTPYIDPTESPCLLCEGFPCAAACPTGALQTPSSVQAVSLGKAYIDMGRCISGRENLCEKCALACPDGIKAILIDRKNGWVSISSYLCVGCGQCIGACPQTPSAIVVLPWGGA
jgi:ferredoxin-type protein NapG